MFSPCEFESRASARLPHDSRVKVKPTDNALFHRGRLVNYSRNGVYFETDLLLEPGAEIFLAIEDSPFEGAEVGGHDLWHGVVRHCSLIDSFCRYGCGAELMYRLGSAFFRSKDGE